MNNHYTVTIHDDNGVKQFSVNKFVKKIVLYIALFILSSTILGVGTILYLNMTVDKIKERKNSLKSDYADLILKNEKLKKNIGITNKLMKQKQQELNSLSSSLTEIENLIGLTPSADQPLQERVKITKLSSQNIATLMQFLPNGSPIEYNGITSKFGYRIHPTLHTKEFHPGIDMKAKMNTPVYATADGIIEWAGYHKSSGYGNLIIIKHNYGFRTYFGHLHKVTVKSGKFVKKGDLIAYTGTSGMSNGPHLHYEVRYMGRILNPFWFIKWTVQNYQEIFQKEKKVPWQSLITATAQIKLMQQTPTPPLSQMVQK